MLLSTILHRGSATNSARVLKGKDEGLCQHVRVRIVHPVTYTPPPFSSLIQGPRDLRPLQSRA